jgi:ABC-2 type transport system permease protein
VQTPLGVALPQGTALVRLLGMVGYLAVHLLVVGALAFWLSTVTDAPLAAVGGAVFTTIVFSILDQVSQLGSIRDWFPTAYGFAWTDLLQTPVDSSDLFRGVVQGLVYVVVLTALGFRHFARRDVTS